MVQRYYYSNFETLFITVPSLQEVLLSFPGSSTVFISSRIWVLLTRHRIRSLFLRLLVGDLGRLLVLLDTSEQSLL